MENQQVEKFDPSKLMDGVKDRIKATFVSLIPDEQWEQMVNAESKKFFEPQRILENSYNNTWKTIPSEFEQLVTKLMKEKAEIYIKELLNDPKYAITNIWQYNNNTQLSESKIQLSEHLDNMIKEKMPDMLEQMFKNMISSSFYNLFSQMQNTNLRGY